MSADAMSDSMVAAWASVSALLGPITRALTSTPCCSATSAAAAAHPCSNDAELVAPVAASDTTKFNGSPASSLAAIRSASTKLPHASSATWGGPAGSSSTGSSSTGSPTTGSPTTGSSTAGRSSTGSCSPVDASSVVSSPAGSPPGSGGDSCSCSSGTDGAGGALSSSLPQAAASKASMLTAANIFTYISLI